MYRAVKSRQAHLPEAGRGARTGGIPERLNKVFVSDQLMLRPAYLAPLFP
jgi:hypothetical protein